MNAAIVISAGDNVATALEALEPGQVIRAGAATVQGSAIGHASTGIAAGAHVHVHNVASDRGRGDLAEGTR